MADRTLVPYLFSGFDDFFAPSPFMTSALERPFLTNADTMLRRSSPCYEVTEDDKQFQVAADVPGVKASDINVQLEHGGRVLSITGGRKIRKGDSYSETKFEKRFTVGSNIDASKIKANLSDGVLCITAPKKLKKEPEVQKITITEGPAPMAAEEEKKD